MDKGKRFYWPGGAGGIGGSSNSFAMIKDKLIMLAQQMINTLQGMSGRNNGGFNGGFNGRFNGDDFGFNFGSIGASNLDYNFGFNIGQDIGKTPAILLKKEKKKE